MSSELEKQLGFKRLVRGLNTTNSNMNQGRISNVGFILNSSDQFCIIRTRLGLELKIKSKLRQRLVNLGKN